MFVPMPLASFVVRRLISSLIFATSAIVVYVIKDKIEEKRYEKNKRKFQ